MKMQFINKIENVKSFTIRMDNLYFITKDMKISGALDIDLSFIGSDHSGEIFILDFFLIWQDSRGKCFVYDLKNNKKIFSNSIESKEFTFRRIDLSSEGFLLVDSFINSIESLCLYNFSDNEFSPIKFNISDSVQKGQLLLDWHSEIDKLKSINLKGKTIWSFEITDIYFNTLNKKRKVEVRGILGSYNNILWCSLSSGKLLGINKITGELIHEIGYKECDFGVFPFEIKINEYIPYGEAVQLDIYKGEIVGLRNDYFMRIDLKQSVLKREYISISQSMKAHEISSSYRNYEFPMDDKFIYFCDDRAGKIGIFDRQLLEVIWSYELDMVHNGIAQILEMEFSNNRWYVLDCNNTLHVFEKTDTETH